MFFFFYTEQHCYLNEPAVSNLNPPWCGSPRFLLSSINVWTQAALLVCFFPLRAFWKWLDTVTTAMDCLLHLETFSKYHQINSCTVWTSSCHLRLPDTCIILCDTATQLWTHKILWITACIYVSVRILAAEYFQSLHEGVWTLLPRWWCAHMCQ